MFFERPQSGETAVLVHLELGCDSDGDDPREFEELVLSAGGDPASFIFGQRQQPDPRTFVGAGKLEEIHQAVLACGAKLVIFNNPLSPSQERNLEHELKCRVVDRTGLILDIFAMRARSHIGKLQVELAQLRHLSTRLVRGWTHLERQKGGIGLRGPGETQLESDRRMVRERIKAITGRLGKVHKQRAQGRRARERAEVPTVSLVGYTNAGKSTLFNCLTESTVYAADQLFATLDPTMRRCDLSPGSPMVLADTVGFIRHLPHQLVEAFRATLEEARMADLLIHVIDASAQERQDNIDQVQLVLEEISADQVPTLEVYNKLDLIPGSAEPRIERDSEGKPVSVWLSAATGSGIELLREAVAEILYGELVRDEISLRPEQGRLRARLYARGAVLAEEVDEQGVSKIQVRLPRLELNRLLEIEGQVQ